jgi:hypothetical protein
MMLVSFVVMSLELMAFDMFRSLSKMWLVGSLVISMTNREKLS